MALRSGQLRRSVHQQGRCATSPSASSPPRVACAWTRARPAQAKRAARHPTSSAGYRKRDIPLEPDARRVRASGWPCGRRSRRRCSSRAARGGPIDRTTDSQMSMTLPRGQRTPRNPSATVPRYRRGRGEGRRAEPRPRRGRLTATRSVAHAGRAPAPPSRRHLARAGRAPLPGWPLRGRVQNRRAGSP